MGEYIIKEDTLKLILYTVGNCILSFLLMILAAQLYIMGKFLLAFFTLTAIWFSVKYMLRYGIRLVKNKPVCSFNDKEVTIRSSSEKNKTFSYRDINEVKILTDWKSVKFFFSGKQVVHPSGWDYVGVIYPFKRNELKVVENQVVAILEKHHVKINKVSSK
jgi:hypothetical protein